MGAPLPSPQLLEAYSQFFRLLSEPARLQLLCLLRQGPLDVGSLIETTGFSQSHISRQLDQLCTLVQGRLRERLEEQMRELRAA